MARMQDSCKGTATNIEIKEVSEDQIVKNCLWYTR